MPRKEVRPHIVSEKLYGKDFDIKCSRPFSYGRFLISIFFMAMSMLCVDSASFSSLAVSPSPVSYRKYPCKFMPYGKAVLLCIQHGFGELEAHWAL